MDMKLKKSTVALLISLAVLVVVSLLNWGVVTSWGKVRITNITMAGDDGKEYTALLYTPKTATNANPAPAYLCLHGYSGNARNHESWAMEYAKRGFVVLSVDNYGSGDSEFAEPLSTAASTATASAAAAGGSQSGAPAASAGAASGAATSAATAGRAQGGTQSASGSAATAGSAQGGAPKGGAMGNASNNLIPVMFAKYLAGLPNVDAENIVIGGHSMGCQAATSAAQKIAAKALVLCEPMGASTRNLIGKPSTLWEWGTADKLRTEEKDLETACTFFKALGANVEAEANSVTSGKTYANAEGSVFLHVFIPKMVHEAAFVNATAIGTQIAFVQNVLGDAVSNPIDATKQTWFIKDFTGLAGVAAFVVFVCCLVVFLMDQVPFFGSLRQEMPRNIGLRGFGFWLSVGVGIFVPFLTTYFANLGLNGLFGAKSAYSNVEYGIFRLRFTNIALAVTIALTIIGGLMLLLFIFTDGKKQKAKVEDFGLVRLGSGKKVDWCLIGKCALLAVTVLMISYTYLTMQRQILRTDFYTQFFGIRAVQSRKFVYYIPYIILWCICFSFSAISMNVERRLPSTGNETRDLVLQIIFNAVLNAAAVFLLVVLEHIFQTAKGAGVYGLPKWGTDLTRLWGMPLGMFVAGAGSTFCYRKTGSIWTGAFLFGTICALMACTFGCLHLA